LAATAAPLNSEPRIIVQTGCSSHALLMRVLISGICAAIQEQSHGHWRSPRCNQVKVRNQVVRDVACSFLPGNSTAWVRMLDQTLIQGTFKIDIDFRFTVNSSENFIEKLNILSQD